MAEDWSKVALDDVNVFAGNYSIRLDPPSNGNTISYTNTFSSMSEQYTLNKCLTIATFEYDSTDSMRESGWYAEQNANETVVYSPSIMPHFDGRDMTHFGFYGKTIGDLPCKMELELWYSSSLGRDKSAIITVSVTQNEWNWYEGEIPSWSVGGDPLIHSRFLYSVLYNTGKQPLYVDNLCIFEGGPSTEYDGWMNVQPMDISFNRDNRLVSILKAGHGEIVRGSAADILEGRITFAGNTNIPEYKFYDTICDGTSTYVLRTPYFKSIVHARSVNFGMVMNYKGTRFNANLDFMEDTS